MYGGTQRIHGRCEELLLIVDELQNCKIINYKDRTPNINDLAIF